MRFIPRQHRTRRGRRRCARPRPPGARYSAAPFAGQNVLAIRWVDPKRDWLPGSGGRRCNRNHRPDGTPRAPRRVPVTVTRFRVIRRNFATGAVQGGPQRAGPTGESCTQARTAGCDRLEPSRPRRGVSSPRNILPRRAITSVTSLSAICKRSRSASGELRWGDPATTQ